MLRPKLINRRIFFELSWLYIYSKKRYFMKSSKIQQKKRFNIKVAFIAIE